MHYIAQQISARLVVRFNGGPQAAHNVTTFSAIGNGEIAFEAVQPSSVSEVHQCYSSFPAGMLLRGVRGLIGGDVLVDIPRLMNEAHILSQKSGDDPLRRLSIDSR